MPSMDAAFHSQGPLLMPAVFSASALSYDSIPMYGAGPVVPQPPPPPPPNPPPKWGQTARQSWKRNKFHANPNSKRNNRGPSTKVNINRLRQKNAKGARKHFQAGKAEPPQSVPPAPYNSNTFLCHQAARRSSSGHQRRNRGQQQQARHQPRHQQQAREQTPSTIQASPRTVSDRLNIRPDEVAWTAGGQPLTSEQVAMANSFDPLDSGMQLIGFDSDTDNEDSSTPDSDAEKGQSIVPGSQTYMGLPAAVRQKLQDLEGEVERLHEENARLKERFALHESADAAIEGAGEVSEMSAGEL